MVFFSLGVLKYVCVRDVMDMDLYEVPLFMSVWFWDGDYVSQLPHVWYYVSVKSSFQHASPRGHMCFRFLMFSLSGPCYFYFVLLPLGLELWLV